MSKELWGVKHHVLKDAQKYMDKGLPGYRVTSPFTGDRNHPVTGVNKPHHGVDMTGAYGWHAVDWIIAPWSGEIVAKRDGVTLSAVGGSVQEIQKQGVTGGNYIKLKHVNGYETQYLHLAVNTLTTKKIGEQVKAGEVLGYMGTTGMSTGVHLHFEVIKNKVAVEPTQYLLGQKSIYEGVDNMGYIKLDKTLKYGDRGEDVKRLQWRLCQISEEFEKDMKSHSFTKAGEPDGGFGKGTENLLKVLQKNLKIKETGQLDAETMLALNRPVWEFEDKSKVDKLEKEILDKEKELDKIKGAIKILKGAI